MLCQVEPEWEKATLRFEREHVASFDHQNDSYETSPAPWQPTISVNTSVTHQFTLQQAQNMPGMTVLGTSFFIPPKDPIAWEVKGAGPDVYSGTSRFNYQQNINWTFNTGKLFHRELENPFYFETESEASKSSEVKSVIPLPRLVQGKTKSQVSMEWRIYDFEMNFFLSGCCQHLQMYIKGSL